VIERKVKFDDLDGVVSGATERGTAILTHGAGCGTKTGSFVFDKLH